ncbi:unnamed protein product [Anisakis simplex]|uniref:G_PROTEIN_RECEP_F1_2 domain-containing protein n=1 Tax=Anisakis simplex TaxID=6269 RepID=A0A0M3K695_ANISI|nr:unnamed protein product [Anisakis simplex]
MTPLQTDYQRRAQVRMTITVTISSCLTLFLDAVPRAIGIYGTEKKMTESSEQCESAMSILFHLTKLNAMFNLIIYYCRNKAIRQSIQNLLRIRKVQVTSVRQANVVADLRPSNQMNRTGAAHSGRGLHFFSLNILKNRI